MAVDFQPEGYHSVTPYLVVSDAVAALAFYQKAFNATEVMRLTDPSGGIAHAEFQVGDCRIMMAGEYPEMDALGPKTVGGTPVSFCVYVPNVDELFQQAIAAGAIEKRPVQDQFYGDRSGTLEDPFGHKWTLATHIEDVTTEEAQKRFDAMMQGGE